MTDSKLVDVFFGAIAEFQGVGPFFRFQKTPQIGWPQSRQAKIGLLDSPDVHAQECPQMMDNSVDGVIAATVNHLRLHRQQE
ncbi:MAG: hypothetical protein A2Y70_08125 [Candidatus Aminicenantes bacterium RBG_13_64_14]|nr:MAG: hypothetical protein A2Y70_08125 [Candidatus Aminicenantes bacterium RBG_13_64_14]